MEQVHGSKVTLVGKNDLGKTIKESDALITNQKGVFLSVRVADCLPIFIYDLKTESIGVIHAGWRGLNKGVIKNTILLMKKKFKVVSKNLKIYIGPHICEKHYQVGEEVSRKFVKYNAKGSLDISAIARVQMKELGISIKNIKVDESCTFEDKSLFSYRRDKTAKRNIYTFGLDI